MSLIVKVRQCSCQRNKSYIYNMIYSQTIFPGVILLIPANIISIELKPSYSLYLNAIYLIGISKSLFHSSYCVTFQFAYCRLSSDLLSSSFIHRYTRLKKFHISVINSTVLSSQRKEVLEMFIMLSIGSKNWEVSREVLEQSLVCSFWF